MSGFRAGTGPGKQASGSCSPQTVAVQAFSTPSGIALYQEVRRGSHPRTSQSSMSGLLQMASLIVFLLQSRLCPRNAGSKTLQPSSSSSQRFSKVLGHSPVARGCKGSYPCTPGHATSKLVRIALDDLSAHLSASEQALSQASLPPSKGSSTDIHNFARGTTVAGFWKGSHPCSPWHALSSLLTSDSLSAELPASQQS